MKKGFTLVELLAAIVVLSIISLVTIPIVTNVINTGKDSALENSTVFYVKELETNYSEWVVEGVPAGIVVDKSSSGYDIFNVIDLNSILKLEGTVPVSGTLKINNNYNNSRYGNVISAYLEYDGGYIVAYTYDGKEVDIEISKKGL